MRRLLFLVPLLLGLAAADRVPVAATPISRMDTPWWKARHLEKLAEIKRGPVDLVWLGDSITEDWEMQGPPDWRNFVPAWQRFYGDRRAVNLGFKGDSTSHLLWRLRNGEIDGLHPKLAIVLIGANNLGRVHWNAEQTVAGIDAIVTDLRQRVPTTKILLLSVLPSIRSKYVTKTTAEINHELAELFPVDGPVAYMDVTGVFMRNGEVDRAQFLDDLLTPPEPPLHPTAAAQQRLAEAIEPTVASLMGDRRH